MALSLDSLLQIDLPPFQQGTQVCDTFGLHAQHTTLHQLWGDGDASVVALAAVADSIHQTPAGGGGGGGGWGRSHVRRGSGF